MRKPPSKQRPLGETELYAYALNSLAARASSIGQMRMKLERRAIRKSDVDVVITRLREAGYLNDKRFAESFAGWRMENQKLGRRRVERDLRAKRVAPVVAQAAIANVYEEVDETAMIREHIAKRIRRTGVPKDRKAIASLFRHLVTAGFSPDAIFPELRKLGKEDVQAIEEASFDTPDTE